MCTGVFSFFSDGFLLCDQIFNSIQTFQTPCIQVIFRLFKPNVVLHGLHRRSTNYSWACEEDIRLLSLLKRFLTLHDSFEQACSHSRNQKVPRTDFDKGAT